MFRNTAQMLYHHGILDRMEPNIFSLTNELILECDKLGRTANAAEISYIENSIPPKFGTVVGNTGALVDIILPTDPRLEFDGIRRTREFHLTESFNFH